jgi:flagellin
MTNSIGPSPDLASLLGQKSLNQTTSQLQTIESQISTGLNIQTASDNPVIWNIAQGQNQALDSLKAVSTSLSKAQSVLDVSVAAGQTVSDLLTQIKTKVLSGTDHQLDTASLNALSSDVQSLLAQIKRTVDGASFNGVSLIQTSSTALQTLTDADTSSLTLQPQSLALGGPNVSLTLGSGFSTTTQATSLLSLVNTSLTAVTGAVADLGSESNALAAHQNLVSTFQDTLTAGVGGLVDADLAKDSASLSALQVKQQLSIQSISIANSTSSTLLSLLR